MKRYFKIDNERYGRAPIYMEEDLLHRTVWELAECLLPSWDCQRPDDDARPPTTLDEVIAEIMLDVVELDNDNYRIIVDNNDGYILQLGDWARKFKPSQINELVDVLDMWFKTESTEGFEKHDISSLDIELDWKHREVNIIDLDSFSEFLIEAWKKNQTSNNTVTEKKGEKEND